MNKENFMKIKDSLNRQSDLIHILKIAFDMEVDSTLISQQAQRTQKSCHEILNTIFSA